MNAGDNRLEPDTVADSDDGHCLHSIAISLKRIADAVSAGGTVDRLAGLLDPENPEGFLRASINCYGEGIGEALQGQLVRGQRGIDQYEGR